MSSAELQRFQGNIKIVSPGKLESAVNEKSANIGMMSLPRRCFMHVLTNHYNNAHYNTFWLLINITWNY